MKSEWYRRIFPTRLAQHRQAVQEIHHHPSRIPPRHHERWLTHRTRCRHHLARMRPRRPLRSHSRARQLQPRLSQRQTVTTRRISRPRIARSPTTHPGTRKLSRKREVAAWISEQNRASGHQAAATASFILVARACRLASGYGRPCLVGRRAMAIESNLSTRSPWRK